MTAVLWLALACSWAALLGSMLALYAVYRLTQDMSAPPKITINLRDRADEDDEDELEAEIADICRRGNAGLHTVRPGAMTKAYVTVLTEIPADRAHHEGLRFPYSDVSCGATYAVTLARRYTCTRRRGHTGDHVAHFPDKTAAARWPAGS